ncbi:MAG: hypothetical protein KJ593_00605 [Candidatus Omnitrophica bacterium]|nr:hypothetical protein [Candidatus Omnitrophota bacterium]
MKTNRAITLAEFMIAAFVFLVVSLALVLTLNYTRQSIEVVIVSTELQEEMYNALSLVTAELRETTSTKINDGPILADGMWYNSITFAIPYDIDADGDILDSSGLIEWSDQNPANWTLTYALSGSQLIRTAGDGRAPILANHVTSLLFRRSVVAPSFIDVSIILQKDTFFNRTIEISLTNQVKMRNEP